MVDPQRLAQDARVNYALEVFTAAILNIQNPQPRGVREMTPMGATNNLVAALCAAHLDALAAGEEGLKFEKAFRDAVTATFGEMRQVADPHDDEIETSYQYYLDRQHRAIVGALKELMANALMSTQDDQEALRVKLADCEADLHTYRRAAEAAEARVKTLESLLSGRAMFPEPYRCGLPNCGIVGEHIHGTASTLKEVP